MRRISSKGRGGPSRNDPPPIADNSNRPYSLSGEMGEKPHGVMNGRQMNQRRRKGHKTTKKGHKTHGLRELFEIVWGNLLVLSYKQNTQTKKEMQENILRRGGEMKRRPLPRSDKTSRKVGAHVD